MQRLFSIGFVFFLFIFALATQARAFTITSDPQYIVMNFSEINELNWAASEDEWQSTIKPKILNQLRQLKTALPPGTINRKLERGFAEFEKIAGGCGLILLIEPLRVQITLLSLPIC